MTQDVLAESNIFILIKLIVIAIVWLVMTYSVFRKGQNWQIYGVLSLLLLNFAADDLRNILFPLPPPPPPPVIISQPAPTPVAKVEVQVEQAKTAKAEQAKIDNSKIVIPANTKVPFSNISEFNEENSKQQAYVDWLKERYETWLITYYYLQKCNKVSDKDLPIITESLLKELDGVHADKSIKDSIILAANGSYSELYSNIPCDDAHIKDSKISYDVNMKQITPTKAPEKIQAKAGTKKP